jgi:hypothetical protein
MSAEHCFDYFRSCGDVFEALIAEMPRALQEKLRHRLRDLAVKQAEEGELQASYFSRVVSGEKPAAPQPAKRAHLRLVVK